MDKLTTNDGVAGNSSAAELRKRAAEILAEVSQAVEYYGVSAGSLSQEEIQTLFNYITRLEAVAEATKDLRDAFRWYNSDETNNCPSVPQKAAHEVDTALNHAGWE